MALMALSLGFVSCSDTWDDHYDERPASADKTLLQLIKEDSSLSDFLQLLQNTHLYNNNHRTNVTYADLLDCDQSLTVWAPKNGTFDIESLLKECATEQGDSMTGQHIVGNHIAHTLFLSTKLDTQLGYIRMHNNKQIVIEDMPSCLSTDIPARNGLLNIVGEALPYSYNLYECLTSMDNAAHIGRFLKKYERQELDENASIQRGIEDGKKVYSDSVMIRENILFRTFGKISDEDSSYVAFLPTEEIWKDALDEASPISIMVKVPLPIPSVNIGRTCCSCRTCSITGTNRHPFLIPYVLQVTPAGLLNTMSIIVLSAMMESSHLSMSTENRNVATERFTTCMHGLSLRNSSISAL